MQIIRSTLGIQPTLSGMKTYFYRPTLALRKTLRSTLLSDRRVESLATTSKKGLSRFASLNKRSWLLSNPTLKASATWKHEFLDDIELEPLILKLDELSIDNYSEVEADSNITSLLALNSNEGITSLEKEFPEQMIGQNQAKAKELSKRTKNKSKSKPKSKKILFSFKEGNNQSFPQENTELSVVDNNKISNFASSTSWFEDTRNNGINHSESYTSLSNEPDDVLDDSSASTSTIPKSVKQRESLTQSNTLFASRDHVDLDNSDRSNIIPIDSLSEALDPDKFTPVSSNSQSFQSVLTSKKRKKKKSTKNKTDIQDKSDTSTTVVKKIANNALVPISTDNPKLNAAIVVGELPSETLNVSKAEPKTLNVKQNHFQSQRSGESRVTSGNTKLESNVVTPIENKSRAENIPSKSEIASTEFDLLNSKQNIELNSTSLPSQQTLSNSKTYTKEIVDSPFISEASLHVANADSALLSHTTEEKQSVAPVSSVMTNKGEVVEGNTLKEMQHKSLENTLSDRSVLQKQYVDSNTSKVNSNSDANKLPLSSTIHVQKTKAEFIEDRLTLPVAEDKILLSQIEDGKLKSNAAEFTENISTLPVAENKILQLHIEEQQGKSNAEVLGNNSLRKSSTVSNKIVQTQQNPSTQQKSETNYIPNSIPPNRISLSADILSVAETTKLEIDTATASAPTTENLPSLQGFAVGGQVTALNTPSSQQIASSDTVPAMLTPGEFVINARDTEKNLNLLQHINSSGEVTSENLHNLTATPAPETITNITSNQVPTKVDTTLVQRQTEVLPATLEPLVPLSSGLENGKLGSTLSSLQTHSLSTVTTTSTGATTARGEQSDTAKVVKYSSPQRIFRKSNPTIATDSPAQWSSVEDLLHETTQDADEFAPLNFGSSASDRNSVTSTSASPRVFAKRLPESVGLAAGGEVITPVNTITSAQNTAVIANPSPTAADASDLEALARAIYNRLRQRLELERERHGLYFGRLPW